MQAMSANASGPRAPQRSPFAIQELLGLSDNRESRERYFERGDGDRVLNLSESREPRSPYTPQFPLPASVASRVAYAAAFNAQASVAAAFLHGPPLLHPPPGESLTLFVRPVTNYSQSIEIGQIRKLVLQTFTVCTTKHFNLSRYLCRYFDNSITGITVV